MAKIKVKDSSKPCDAIHVNKRRPDFTCSLNQGHGGAHLDPLTQVRWGESEVPLGLKRKRKIQ